MAGDLHILSSGAFVCRLASGSGLRFRGVSHEAKTFPGSHLWAKAPELRVNAEADPHAEWVVPEGVYPHADIASESGTAIRQPNGTPG